MYIYIYLYNYTYLFLAIYSYKYYHEHILYELTKYKYKLLYSTKLLNNRKPLLNYYKLGKPYYFDKEKNETTWKQPPDYSAWKEKEINKYSKKATSNFQDWRTIFDVKKNKNYYYNRTSKVTTWDAPKEISDYEAYLRKLSVKRRNKNVEKLKKAVVNSVVSSEAKDEENEYEKSESMESKKRKIENISTVSTTNTNISTNNINSSSSTLQVKKIQKRKKENLYIDPESDIDNDDDYVNDNIGYHTLLTPTLVVTPSYDGSSGTPDNQVINLYEYHINIMTVPKSLIVMISCEYYYYYYVYTNLLLSLLLSVLIMTGIIN